MNDEELTKAVTAAAKAARASTPDSLEAAGWTVGQCRRRASP